MLNRLRDVLGRVEMCFEGPVLIGAGWYFGVELRSLKVIGDVNDCQPTALAMLIASPTSSDVSPNPHRASEGRAMLRMMSSTLLERALTRFSFGARFVARRPRCL